MEVDSAENENFALKNCMLQHISLNNEAHFKSQQLNEPDLTIGEKYHIAEEILEKNPGCFLSRFGNFLLEKHLDYFKEMALVDYEVNYYIKDLIKKFQRTHSKSVVRNRRLEALRRLTLNGEYFSDEEMRKRNPLMYEHLVGQYLTEEEKITMHAERIESKSFTGIILNAIDEREIEDRLNNEKENEEFDTESDSDSSSEEKLLNSCSSWGEISPKVVSSTATAKKRKKKTRKSLEPVSDEEKNIMMNEFRSHVFSEFLGGKDSEFDYTKVDANNDYDDLDMLEIDQQDKYFDSESPELIQKGEESSDSSIISGDPPPRNLVQKMADLET